MASLCEWALFLLYNSKGHPWSGLKTENNHSPEISESITIPKSYLENIEAKINYLVEDNIKLHQKVDDMQAAMTPNILITVEKPADAHTTPFTIQVGFPIQILNK